jgi:DNA-binding NarL/FixJ family response regulator
MAEPKIRLMLVDDHPLVRDGLRSRLETVPGFAVVAEADSAQTALDALTDASPDLVLIDVAMRGTSGIEATRRLLALRPGLLVLVLSMHDDPAYVREAMTAGARGYLLKDSPA